LLADRPTYDALLDGKGIPAMRSLWEPELRAFLRVRSKYLLYE
jgi:hypothetical protein